MSANNFYKPSKTCQIPNLPEYYEQYFGTKSNGIFVEVGAYDGDSFSNTSCLSDVGWGGLYIEPVPQFAQACANRHKGNTRVLVAQRAVGEPGFVTLYVGGTLTTTKKGHVDAYNEIDWAKGHHRGESIQVKRDRLDKLMKRGGINPEFDVLVVDVEGSEYEVFETFSLAEWRPKMMIVELEDKHHSFQKYKDIIEPCAALRNLILLNGYKELFVDEINTIFIREDLVK